MISLCCLLWENKYIAFLFTYILYPPQSKNYNSLVKLTSVKIKKHQNESIEAPGYSWEARHGDLVKSRNQLTRMSGL